MCIFGNVCFNGNVFTILFEFFHGNDQMYFIENAKKKINTTLLPQSNVPCNIVFVGEKWAMYICFSFE